MALGSDAGGTDLRVPYDKDTGQTLISDGRAAPRDHTDRLVRASTSAHVGKPPSHYRETSPRGGGRGRYIRRRRRGQFGHSKVRMRRRPGGYIFNNKIVGGVIPRSSSSAPPGIKEAHGRSCGDYTGNGVRSTSTPQLQTDVGTPRDRVQDRRLHGIPGAAGGARPVLMEPGWRWSVGHDRGLQGGSSGHPHRGATDSSAGRTGHASWSLAKVPLSEMFGYARLRSMSQGPANYRCSSLLTSTAPKSRQGRGRGQAAG